MKKASIIIAVRDQAEKLERCLEGIESNVSGEQDFEIIVVDNASREDINIVVSRFPKAKYLREEKKGASFARNKGISEALGEILVFLDADSIPAKNWLNNITKPFEDDSIGAVGGSVFPVNPRNTLSRYLGVSLFLRYQRHGDRHDVKGLPSCNLAVRKELAKEGFDTKVFTTYAEDKDLCYRIMAGGKKIVFEPSAAVYHHNAETFGEFVRLLNNSSIARVAFGKKYPNAPDIVFFNTHLPLLYSVLLIFSALKGGATMFFLILSPAAIVLLYNSFVSYSRSRDAFISLLVKPVLDCFSIIYIYVIYTLKKHGLKTGKMR
jgi:glycosyltransferase involved in cell wall biosynthesis